MRYNDWVVRSGSALEKSVAENYIPADRNTGAKNGYNEPFWTLWLALDDDMSRVSVMSAFNSASHWYESVRMSRTQSRVGDGDSAHYDIDDVAKRCE
jgi:hypothetical protein